jgi:choline-sulfatase
LFDLQDDPHEAEDLAARPEMQGVLKECEAALRAILNPEQVSARAFADQAARIAVNGGVGRILQRGDFGYTPAPGEKAGFA